jgi:hypothetical protein
MNDLRGVTSQTSATREAPVRTEPDPTWSFALPAPGAPASAPNLSWRLWVKIRAELSKPSASEPYWSI